MVSFHGFDQFVCSCRLASACPGTSLDGSSRTLQRRFVNRYTKNTATTLRRAEQRVPSVYLKCRQLESPGSGGTRIAGRGLIARQTVLTPITR